MSRKEILKQRYALHTWVTTEGNTKYEYCKVCMCIKNDEPPRKCDAEWLRERRRKGYRRLKNGKLVRRGPEGL